MAYLNGQKILLKSNVTTSILPIDQSYNPESENAQSGKAVAEAVANVSDGTEKEWELLDDIALTEAVVAIQLPVDKMNAKNEVHIEAYILPTDATVTNQPIQFNNGTVLWQTSVSFKSAGKAYLMMDIYKSPRNTTIFDGIATVYSYTVGGASFKITNIDENLSIYNSDNLLERDVLMLRMNSNNLMAAGTKVKVWGR